MDGSGKNPPNEWELPGAAARAKHYLRRVEMRQALPPGKLEAYLHASEDPSLEKLFNIRGKADREALLETLKDYSLSPDASLSKILRLIKTELDLEDDPKKAERLCVAFRIVENIVQENDEWRAERANPQKARATPSPLRPEEEVRNIADRTFMLTELDTGDRALLLQLIRREKFPEALKPRMLELADNTENLKNFGELTGYFRALGTLSPDSRPRMEKIAGKMAEALGIAHQYQRYLEDGRKGQSGREK